jgi:DNA-binding SARP family transcriptional activator
MEDKILETAKLKICVLGNFQVWKQQELLVWPTQKSKALLQILLIEPGRLVPKEQIIDFLWPNLPTNKAKNNLWVTISQLRRVLEPNLPARSRSFYILKQGDGYCFNSESEYWLDSETFATFLITSKSAKNLNERIFAWEAARALYQGGYIEDEPYSEWTQYPRTQWRRRYEQLLTNLAEAYGQNGNFRQAITQCRGLLVLDNTNETTYRLLMRCHASLGERGQALKVYYEAVEALQDELGLVPMPETEELAHQIEQMEGDWRFEIEQSQTSSSFVGRNKEIDLVNQLLTQTAKGQGRILIFSGEPGIGKTCLIQEVTRLASRIGFQVLSAQCYQMEKALPYQPLIDLARQLMKYDNNWQQMATVWLHELAALVPEMEEGVVTETQTTLPQDELDESKQGRLFQAFFQLFANKANRHKLVVVIEDIQWADATTLQCLHYLARHITQVPITLIISVREENLLTDADLASLLHNIIRETHSKSLPLSRLTKKETKALLMKSTDTAPYSDRLGNWLYNETVGHPFFLTSLLQYLREEGLLNNDVKTDWEMFSLSEPGLALPDAIRDSVLSRLQRLTQFEREVLDWMAVYGRSLDFSALQIFIKQKHITLLNAVEQLVALQLLEDGTGTYDFNHNKIKEVIYQDLSGARCLLYHQQIGAALEKSKPPLDMAAIIAYHFEHGEDNEKALKYWMLAGEHALDTYAYELAAYHFEQALALTDQPAAQMDAYLGLGRTLMLQDDHKATAGVIQQGLLLAEHHSDDTRRAKLLYANAQNASRQHRTDGGIKEVEAALLAAEQAGDDNYLAQSLLLLTEVHESSGNLSHALETATRARIVSSQLKDNQLEARALVEIGFLYAQRAEFDDAVSSAERGLELLELTDDRNAIAYAWNILGRALGGRGDYGQALDAFQNSQEEAEKVGDRYLLAQALNMKGWLYRELGDYDNSLKFDQEGVKFAQQWGKPSPEISARLNVCLDVQHFGNPGRALEILEKIEKEIEVGAFGFHKWRWRIRLLHTRGLCYLSLNEPVKVLELAEEGLTLAETNVTRKYVALNHELRGLAFGKLGSIDKSIAVIETAVSQADKIKYQPVRWRGRFQLAKLYKEKDRLQAAEQTSVEAKGIIQVIADELKDTNLKKIFINSTLNNS